MAQRPGNLRVRNQLSHPLFKSARGRPTEENREHSFLLNAVSEIGMRRAGAGSTAGDTVTSARINLPSSANEDFFESFSHLLLLSVINL